MAVICNNTGRVVSSVQYTSFSSDTAITVQGRVGATRHPAPSLKVSKLHIANYISHNLEIFEIIQKHVLWHVHVIIMNLDQIRAGVYKRKLLSLKVL